jgi:hypothetical protein
MVIQCGHKRAYKEAFRTSPPGVKTATQPHHDLIMDIRHLRHLVRTVIHPIYSPTQSTDATTPLLPSAQLLSPLLQFVLQPSEAAYEAVLSCTPLSHVITLLHQGKPIDNDVRKFIQDAAYAYPLQQKIQKDTGWSDDLFAKVAWPSFYQAIRCVPRSHRISITKLSHHLWNTNYQNNKYYGETDNCPICQASKETVEHVYGRQHPAASEQRAEIVQQFLHTLAPTTPAMVLETIKSGLHQWASTEFRTEFHSPTKGSKLPAFTELTRAFQAQSELGWDAFVRGQIHHLWEKAFLTNFKSKKPLSSSQLQAISSRWMRLVITSAWTFSERIWKFRNGVVHGRTETFELSKSQKMIQDRVRELYGQFTRDPHMLPQSRSHLFTKPREAILTMDKDGISSWIKSVEETIYTREYRDKLEQAALSKTLARYLKPHRTNSTHQHRLSTSTSIWTAPFSDRYYKSRKISKVLCLAKHQRGHTRAPAQQKSRPVSGKRKKAPNVPHMRSLMTFGFQRLSRGVIPSRVIQPIVGLKLDYSGTYVSTTP